MAKGNYSEAHKAAIATLDQICATRANLDQLTERIQIQANKIDKLENEAALRAICVGILLFQAKPLLKHGEYMAWKEKAFPDLRNRQLTYYSHLAVEFVAQTKAKIRELRALPDFADGSANEKLARSIAKKAAEFIGGNSLNELLQMYAGKPKPEPKKLTAPEEEEGEQMSFAYYQTCYNQISLLSKSLRREEALKSLKDEEIETLASELEETRKNLLLFREHRRNAEKAKA